MVESTLAPPDPATLVPLLLAADEQQQIALLSDWCAALGLDALVEVLIAVDYAGAIHRLAITLKFE